MLIFDDTLFGIHKCELLLSDLYPHAGDRKAFQARLESFIASDPAHTEIFSLRRDRLIYSTETFISEQVDDRAPVLLLLGNPASHSVQAGMCFTFERGASEHRFWKGLRKAGVLQFHEDTPETAGPAERTAARRKDLWNLDYNSPFRIGIAVFYSLPSAASMPGWSGVNGVRRLLGGRAFQQVAIEEKRRVDLLISRFIPDAGGIIAFQKDAYEGVRSQASPAYRMSLTMSGGQRGYYRSSQRICVAGAAPTRLMHSKGAHTALVSYVNWLEGKE